MTNTSEYKNLDLTYLCHFELYALLLHCFDDKLVVSYSILIKRLFS